MLKQFPKPHLLAVTGLSLTLATVLLFSPGSDGGSGTPRPVKVPSDPVTTPDQADTPAQTIHASARSSAFSAIPATATPIRDLLDRAGYRDRTRKQGDTQRAPQGTTARSQSEARKPLEWKHFTVESGDSLSRLFKRAGLDDKTMYHVLNGDGETDELTRLQIGKQIEFGFDRDGNLDALVLRNSRTTKLKATRTEDGFRTVEVMRDPDIELAFAAGEIQTSFALAANRAGLGRGLRNNLSRLFGWEIDFSRDLRKGDRFGVLYEKQYLDGEMIGYGRILAASFINKGEEYTTALFTHSDGRSAYYAPDGSSMRKAFLRAPVNYRRISSHFDMNRKHPILNRVRPHEGTDFAASPGTPVRASGDGRISFVGRDGGYGRTVRIEHGNDVTTVYSHLRSYRRGVRSGKTVQQGDTIGYVGMSGLATGPHLHYEYRINGRPRNPLRVSLPDAAPVPEDQMDEFRMQAQPLLAQLSDHDETFQIALAED